MGITIEREKEYLDMVDNIKSISNVKYPRQLEDTIFAYSTKSIYKLSMRSYLLPIILDDLSYDLSHNKYNIITKAKINCKREKNMTYIAYLKIRKCDIHDIS